LSEAGTTLAAQSGVAKDELREKEGEGTSSAKKSGVAF
jgi:hypothetical protein